VDKAPDAFRTISEVAEELKLPQHVLRFWESRFTHIKPMKRAGGRRYYRPDDVDLLRGIQHLLYGQGFTIRGVQGILKERGVKFVETVWQEGAEQPLAGPRHDDAEEGDAPAASASSPAFDDDDDIGDRAPPARRPLAAPVRAAAAPPPEAGLSREDLRKLQATLFELNECRRLLNEGRDG
jgi:DNA-binding transcriptional MerR regulator